MMLMGPFQHEMSYDTMATSLSRHLTAQEKRCLVPVFFFWVEMAQQLGFKHGYASE